MNLSHQGTWVPLKEFNMQQHARSQPCKATILELATSHCISSRRLTRSMADLVAGYHLCKRQTHRDLKAVT